MGLRCGITLSYFYAVFNELLRKKLALGLDFPESWMQSPESALNCLGQIRGALRGMVSLKQTEDLEQMFTLISALEATRTLGPQFAHQILSRSKLRVPGIHNCFHKSIFCHRAALLLFHSRRLESHCL